MNLFLFNDSISEKQEFEIYVGKTESLLYEDYVEIYGEPIVIQTPSSSLAPKLSFKERQQIMLKQMMEGTYVGDQVVYNSTAIPTDEVPEEDMRQLLRDVGMTDEEIEIELDRIYRPTR